MTRLDHLSGLAVVRREAFSNDQWSVAGAQLDRSEYYAAGAFRRDPSQIVRLHDCPVNRWPTLDSSLRAFPRGAFDYLWLVNPPAWDRSLTAGMVPVWTETPPTRRPFSTTRTERPSFAAWMAARRPAGPLPMTMKS